MADIYGHERMRFKSMTLRQLSTRLGRITQPDKLKMFIVVAGEHGYLDLMDQANRKLINLTDPYPASARKKIEEPQSIPAMKKKQTIKPAKEEPSTPLRRHLEF